MAAKERVLLPREVRPKKYRLTLALDLRQFTFSGKEEIEIDVGKATAKIVLHAAELDIQSVQLLQNAVPLSPSSIELDDKSETATFEFTEPLSEGPARLQIAFTGTLNDQMRGFYRSEYTVGDEKRVMAVTQFESTDARRAFPCWDEPALKATFEVTLEVPSDRVAISNMSIVEEKSMDGGLKTVRFAESPIMSTYLLAFIVGEFDFIEDKSREGVRVRVYTPLGKKKQGKFALDVATHTLSFFKEYFKIAYPLLKIDLIAIPDFAAGAMENWGAVTYRETAILVDPKQSSQATRQRVAVVVAHELAHQWFGNLVTMEWWTHLWLNEGFASWIEYLAVDHLFPEWDIWTQFVFSDFGRALGLDGLENSHPVEVEVKDPNEISEIFDAISYSKGASIIRMLVAYLGEEDFRRGLHLYLMRHQYGNATTEDLWKALGEASGKPVKTMMDSWTKQVGYPVLSVEGTTETPTLRQSRFFISGIPRDKEDSTQWVIPVGVTGCSEYSVIKDRTTSIPLPKAADRGTKINPGQTGFYRVNYAPAVWSRLGEAVRSLTLSAADRMGLQNDAFALARAGLLHADHALTLAMAYREETDYTVWADLTANLAELDVLISEEAFYNEYQSLGRDLYSALSERLGWDGRSGESHLTTLLRSLVIGQMGGYGDQETVDEARQRFIRFLEDGQPLVPDLRFPVYRLVVEFGDVDQYESVLELFRKADLHEEKLRCLRALGYSRRVDLLGRTLDLSLSDEVRPQDTPLAVASVAFNNRGRELAWQFLQRHRSDFDRRYGKGGFLLARIISSTTENFTSEGKGKEVEEYFREHPVPAADRTIRQSLERIRSNALWLDRDRDAIGKWLEDNKRS